MGVHPLRLREVIGHRNKMDKAGQNIISNLLLGLKELRKNKMVLRYIHPHFISISEDLK